MQQYDLQPSLHYTDGSRMIVTHCDGSTGQTTLLEELDAGWCIPQKRLPSLHCCLQYRRLCVIK